MISCITARRGRLMPPRDCSAAPVLGVLTGYGFRFIGVPRPAGRRDPPGRAGTRRREPCPGRPLPCVGVRTCIRQPAGVPTQPTRAVQPHSGAADRSCPPPTVAGRASPLCGKMDARLGSRAYGALPRNPSARKPFAVRFGRHALSQGTRLPVTVSATSATSLASLAPWGTGGPPSTGLSRRDPAAAGPRPSARGRVDIALPTGSPWNGTRKWGV